MMKSRFQKIALKVKQEQQIQHAQQHEKKMGLNDANENDFKKLDNEQKAVLISEYLEKVPLLSKLTSDDRYKLGLSFKERIYKPKQIIIRQGDAGYEFFIIRSGEASVTIKNEDEKTENEVAILKPGDYFGETALLTKKTRNATVTAINILSCLVLDKETFQYVFGKERVQVNFGKRGAISAEKGLPHSIPKRLPSRLITEKDEQTKQLIANAVENNVLFASLDEDQVKRIVEKMWLYEVNKGVNIIQQGEAGDNFYVVENGIFDIYVKRDGEEKLVATRSSGESFGELALMYNSVRSATVRARTFCKVWAVERYMFRKILIRVSEDKLKEYEKFLRQVPLLDSLLANERRAVAEALDEVKFKEGDIIIKQGEMGDTFYIIKKGNAIVYKSDSNHSNPKEVLRLKHGDFFGERALVKNDVRAATVQVVNSDMICLCLDRTAFCLLLGPLAELMHRKIDEEYDGKMNVHINSHLNITNANSNHNNNNKMNNNNNNALELNNSSNGNGNSNGNNGLKDDEMQGYNLKEKASKMEKKEIGPRLNIPKKELITIGILGKGSFGSVQLVKYKKTGQTYALKSVAKSQIVNTGQQEHIISEKNVMAQLDSPFIVKLYCTYKDKYYLYFLLEVVLGGELFTVLRARTVFDEPTARFYAASVVSAFDYMHSKNIIYRDLKPENLLLDSNGYLKITDFGFAKIIIDRTYTLCGTPDYLAPEVISGAGHSFGVDWWTLGILLFEMLASYPPFYDEDPMKTYAKIMYGRVKYPKHFSRDVVEIIRGFLAAKATKRLGIIKGKVQLIQSMLWFKDFDWNALYQGNLKAPIIPKIKSSEDRSNFDCYDDHHADDDEEDNLEYEDDGTGWEDDF